MTEQYSIKVVGQCSELEQSEVELLEFYAQKELFLSYEWFNTLEEYVFSQEKEYVIKYYTVFNHDAAELLMPLFEHKKRGSLITVNVLESLSNYYTSFYQPICMDEQKFEKAFSFLIDFIKQEKKIDAVHLKPLDKKKEDYPVIIKTLRKKSFICEDYFCFGNWYLELKGCNYQQYFSTLPSKLRHTITRKHKKLQSETLSGFNVYSKYADLADLFSSFVSIYNNSWKTEETYPEFIKQLALTHACHKQTRLGLLTIDGNTVAAQLWFVKKEKAYIYKLAHDERYKKYSPGTLLTDHIMKHVIDIDKVKIIDFLTGDDTYKKDWMSHRSERWGLYAYNNTIKGRLLSIKYGLQKLFKHVN